jgi:hypothetical protein
MKKSDYAMVIFIASISIMIAFFVANAIPALKPSTTGEKVRTFTTLTDTVSSVDEKVFNSGSINPTVQTVIGSGTQ